MTIMTNQLHWTQHLELLETVISVSRLGIISDFDGTLSEFADVGAEARIVEENAQALDRLADRTALVALVSGRGVADLRGRFERPWIRYYGNHGLDRWIDNQVQIVPAVQEWLPPLQKMLSEFTPPDVPGVFVENKGATATVHYRRAPDPQS